ncbi:ligase [Nocardiopsis suaedae]|uniref:Ligase n=1 Tax=Nocardiopsis suaedae TaxID=3018444 RepID=A0ABT4TTY7_9ACTN|nr:ligase [Nocardiopsis suaedae]MDA2808166.1 ligase [Nocardiopsis suaedae]
MGASIRSGAGPPGGGAAAGPAAGPLASRLFAPGWPVIWLFAGYPLWWALGLGPFAFWVFAVPMAAALLRRHREHGLRLPPGFGLWALFLLWAAAGIALIGMVPDGTLPGSGGVLGALVRLGHYLALTVLLLYIGNTGRDELSDSRIARALGWLFLATAAGGLLGMAAPHFGFTSPLEALLPAGVASDSYVQALIHPSSSQVMDDVLGYETARPKAPWPYTNTWGNMLSLLLPWLAAGWILTGGGRGGWRRWVGLAAVAVSCLPIVHSLNRALWVGLALTAVFALVQLVRSGRAAAALTGVLAAAGLCAALAASPLMDVVTERIGNPHSDDGRAATSWAALDAAAQSPVLGWGTTRDMLGSSDSIAIGSSPECPGCGNHTIGNNGQFWLTLISNGWVGTGLFLGFFAAAAWRHRGERDAVGSAALLSILLLFWYMFFYVALTAPLAVTMTGIALLWRRAPGAVPATAAGGVAR